ncbi:hypothetical protein ATO3_16410 [Marinibacterium profundimaris]|uniref:Sulfotransferase domain-containing protein n=1 Tax=Marinibacterium profundimaris TaxID=1679460 RepID=A0A225NI87_9RHOB|nr:hypothetical protein ATO3_16410 [Marinibacterium profundimaris]
MFVRPGPVAPRRAQVFGERSSGTNFVKRLIGRNTPLRPVEALGWKHGGVQALAIPADLVVVVCVRGAADWARSMHAKPWHAVAALQAMAFSDFIRAPWDSVIDRPRYFDIDGVRELVGQPLQADRDPLTGEIYEDLFALRRGKLAQHLGLLQRHQGVVLVRMEQAVAAPEAFLDALEAGLDLPPRTAFRPVVKRLGAKFKGAVAERPETPASWTEADMAYLRSRVDAELESALGYSY